MINLALLSHMGYHLWKKIIQNKCDTTLKEFVWVLFILKGGSKWSLQQLRHPHEISPPPTDPQIGKSILHKMQHSNYISASKSQLCASRGFIKIYIIFDCFCFKNCTHFSIELGWYWLQIWLLHLTDAMQGLLYHPSWTQRNYRKSFGAQNVDLYPQRPFISTGHPFLVVTERYSGRFVVLCQRTWLNVLRMLDAR